jgi:hypothetical protein
MVQKLLNIETLWNQFIHPQSISSGAQYVTLSKYFSHPSLVMYYFATHLDESLWWANVKHWVPVRSYLLHSLLQVHSAAAPFTSHGNLHNYAEPDPFSWAKPDYIGFSSSNFTVQITYRAPLEMFLHNNFSPIVGQFGCTLAIGGKPLVTET